MAGIGRPVTDEDREAVRLGHAAGKSLGSIARDLGRTTSTVAGIAKKLGLTFDQRPTAHAVQAKVQDNRSRRAALVASLYDIAEDEVAYLRQGTPYDLTEVSAGQAVDYMVARLPAQDRRALLGAISTAAQTAVKLEQIDSDELGMPAVDTWLRSMLGRDEA